VALPAPNLDDRKFQDIVDEAKRLIPRYCPEWTNHNLSDPGVALIELFAWMSELVLFRLNQVPDRLYTKFLDLVGIEQFPPSVAHVDLTFWLSAVLDHAVAVPAGTEVTTGVVTSGGQEVVFTTVEDLVISPPRLLAAVTAADGDEQHVVDVWDDLRLEGSEVVCFTSDPICPGDAVYFGFEESLGGNLLRLTISAGIQGLGVDPNDPPISWEVWSDEKWQPASPLSDSTGGLNRDGSIQLLIPRVMAPLSLGDSRGYWLRGQLQKPRDGQPAYKFSPRIASLRVDALGGTVGAEHATVVGTESIGRSDGSPGQVFTVARPPVLPRREGEGIRTISAQGTATDWEEADDFTQSGPLSPHYVLEAASGTVRFGPSVRYSDGSSRQHGALPADGAEVVMRRYRHGGGSAGNVGANTLNVLRSSVAYIDRVSNLTPASGGVDAETPGNAKLRGPLTLRTGQRAVTVRDFERLTLESSIEVARVRCLPPTSPSAPIQLLVVPEIRRRPNDQELDDFALSDPLVACITEHLEPRRMLGATIEIGTPYYQGVTVAALLESKAGRSAPLVRQQALDLLFRYLNPLTGGPSEEGWPFDTDVNAAPIVEMLAAIEGVERVEEVLLFEFDLRTGTRSGAGRELIHLDEQSLFLSARHQVVVR
jgi:predicted phage baseplate assembly protein